MANRDHSHHRRGKHSSRRHHPAPQTVQNKFANDGSFLENMKKLLEQQKKAETAAVATNARTTASTSSTASTSALPGSSSMIGASPSSSSSQKEATPAFSSITGKRRGPPTLKTGMVKKVKKEEAEDSSSSSDNKDKWSKYLEEVKRIKEQLCIEGEENRPLVK